MGFRILFFHDLVDVVGNRGGGRGGGVGIEGVGDVDSLGMGVKGFLGNDVVVDIVNIFGIGSVGTFRIDDTASKKRRRVEKV